MSEIRDRGQSWDAVFVIWHIVLASPLIAIISFYTLDTPRHDGTQRTASLMKTVARDKAQFIEERLKVGPVLETDVLKLLGSTDLIFEDRGDRLLRWQIREGHLWGVLVRDGTVVATYRPDTPGLPTKRPALPADAKAVPFGPP
jgi:hypothetical protein